VYTDGFAFNALTLLVGRQEVHPACKKTEWWGAGVVICLERGADLHTALLMPRPLTVSCLSKIQTAFTFLVPAHPGSPGKSAVKRVCIYIQVDVYAGRDKVSGSPFTLSVLPFVSPLKITEASSSGVLGQTLSFRVSCSRSLFNEGFLFFFQVYCDSAIL